MAMPAQTSPPRRWTLEEFYRERDGAPQGVRYELVDGEILVTPSPHWTHQRIAAELFVLLHPYVRAQDAGEAFMPPLDVLLEPNLVLQPDLLEDIVSFIILLLVPALEERAVVGMVRHPPAARPNARALQRLHETRNPLAFAHEGPNLGAPLMMGKRPH